MNLFALWDCLILRYAMRFKRQNKRHGDENTSLNTLSFGVTERQRATKIAPNLHEYYRNRNGRFLLAFFPVGNIYIFYSASVFIRSTPNFEKLISTIILAPMAQVFDWSMRISWQWKRRGKYANEIANKWRLKANTKSCDNDWVRLNSISDACKRIWYFILNLWQCKSLFSRNNFLIIFSGVIFVAVGFIGTVVVITIPHRVTEMP